MKTPARKTVVRAGTLSAGLALMAALLVIVNYFGWKYHHRSDWTASGLYTLSEKTENVLAALDRDVEAVVFLPPGDPLSEPTQEVLAGYEASSPRFSVRTLDPERNPLEAQRLAEEYDVSEYSVVVVAGDDRQVIQRADLAEIDYAAMQMTGQPELGPYKGEQLFTGALIALTDDRRPKVVFTTGHGEIGLDDLSLAGLGSLAQLLRNDNFEVEEWATLGRDEVPADTDLVVIAGPTANFLPPEVEMLDRYLGGGGRMLILLDPVLSTTAGNQLLATGLEEWLDGWGVEIGNDVVLDPARTVPLLGSETLVVNDFDGHPITRAVEAAGMTVVVRLGRSVGAGDVPEGYRSAELMRTSSEGWGETDVSAARLEQGEGDRGGPVPMGVVVEAEASAADPAVAGDDDGAGGEAEDADEAEGDDQDAVEAAAEEAAAVSAAAETGLGEVLRRGPMRLVVFGDSDFATERLLRMSEGNGVMLVDTLNWLAERESLLGIPPKEPERVRLNLSGTEMTWVFLQTALLPVLAVVLGVVVWFRRRR